MKFIKLVGSEYLNAELVNRVYLEGSNGKYYVMLEAEDRDDDDCIGSYETYEEAALKLKKVVAALEL